MSETAQEHLRHNLSQGKEYIEKGDCIVTEHRGKNFSQPFRQGGGRVASWLVEGGTSRL